VTRFAQLMHDVADQSQPLSSVLLRARLLAKELRSAELNEWVKLELNGYPNRDRLPDYRIIYPRFFGHFHGSFGAATKNVPLSTMYFPDDIRDLIAQHRMSDNVAAIEQLAASDTEVYNNPQPFYVVEAFREYGEQISNQSLNHVNAVFFKPVIVGILHTVRSRFLEFLIQLSEEFPDLEKDDSALAKVPAPEVTRATQNMILNGCTIIHDGNKSMGDIYNAGQAGAMGPGAHAHDITFQQLWNSASKDLDLSQLASELRALSPRLTEAATAPEHKIAIGNVEAAADAADAGDGPKALQYLKTAGQWTFDTATKIGIGLSIAAAKSYLGF
jgi:hypothetical protein